MKKKAFLLTQLLRRDLTARYAGSFGGPLWAFLNPVILCVLYGLVFGYILRTQPPAGFPGGYAEFLLGGLLPWFGIQEAVMRSASSVTDQAHLVKKLPVPAELLVLSSLGSALLLQMAGILILAAYVALSGRGALHPVPLVLAFVFEALLLVGPALLLSALNVFFRDLPQLLGPALTVVFFLSPILYPESLMPRPLRAALGLNPVRDLVALFRAGLFGGPSLNPERLLVWSLVFGMLGYAGTRFFRRCRRSFADLL